MVHNNTSDVLLSARDLALERGGRQLFEGLSFDVQRGKLIQIAGANGAGKTSLLRILCGLSRYGYDGDIHCTSSLLWLGHKASVKGLLTPRENLSWHVSGESEYDPQQIERALDSVGLYGYEDVPSHALSAGQHRRVNLARLYLSQSPLWLLDEPFTAIDKQGVADLESLMVSHVEGGGAVVLTSHQPFPGEVPVLSLDLQRGLLS